MAPNSIKKCLETMHAKEIKEKCQRAIDEHFKEGHIPKVHSVSKLSEDIYKLHCHSERDPQLLEEINWSSIFNGVTTHRRNYGLAINGIHKADLDPSTLTEEELEQTKQELEEENESRGLHVTKLTLLRHSQKYLQKAAAHHSVVVFTHSLEEANKCLRQGIIIKGKYYLPEKYTPQYNITQCYKCYHYGHMAKHCKSKQKCGKCGSEDHEANNCPNPLKCL